MIPILLNACNPTFESALEDSNLKSNNSVQNDSKNFKKAVRSSNGYLTILNEQKMDSTVEALKVLTPEKRKEWEKFMNFTSLRTLFEQALEEENKFIQERMLNQKEIKKGEHCDFVTQNRDALLIDENGNIQANIFVSDFSYLVNSEGIVRVCGHFFQYKESQMKILEGGNPKKLYKLKKAKEDSPSDKIKIFAVHKKVNPIEKQIDPIYLTNGFTIYPPDNVEGDFIRFDANLSLYWVNYPVLDYANPIITCERDEYDNENCIETYPFLYYAPYSIIDVHFNSKTHNKIVFWYAHAYRNVWKKIEATYTANGVPIYWEKQYYNLAYMNETIYRSYRADIKGSFRFRAASEEVVSYYPSYQTTIREKECTTVLN